jgi:hypothetical protein
MSDIEIIDEELDPRDWLFQSTINKNFRYELLD